ncbi:hypothetical protein DPMN_085249 [Dreissena polymorpha]|uniref:Uncharacterized protein n=1 Tax=Dreissena polymorpha TaxID=45954 RepID=A0A9D3YFQ3_DREPO|nr:hypothetical protein DPMN_085249 [Dreissena polymorpha]
MRIGPSKSEILGKGTLFSELSVVEIKKASAAPRECVSTVVCYHSNTDDAIITTQYFSIGSKSGLSVRPTERKLMGNRKFAKRKQQQKCIA